jgi:hypothetical protein
MQIPLYKHTIQVATDSPDLGETFVAELWKKEIEYDNANGTPASIIATDVKVVKLKIAEDKGKN